MAKRSSIDRKDDSSLFDFAALPPIRKNRPPQPPWRPNRPNPLFIAIRVPPDAAAGIQLSVQDLSARNNLSGSLVDDGRLHISLVEVGGGFLGDDAPRNVVALVTEAVSSIIMPPFKVTLDRAMKFKPIVLLPGEGREAMMQLERALAERLARVGFKTAPPSRFKPHISVLYDAERIEEQAIIPVSWTVEEFVLIYSLYGKTIHKLEGRWPLRG